MTRAAARAETRQQIELALRELDGFFPPHASRVSGVDGHVAPADHVLLNGLRTPHLLEAARSALRDERLDHVVVGAATQACDFVLDGPLCGQHSDRSLGDLAQNRGRSARPSIFGIMMSRMDDLGIEAPYDVEGG